MSRRLAVASLGGLLAAGLLAIGLHAGATEPQRAQAAGDAEARSAALPRRLRVVSRPERRRHRAGPRLARGGRRRRRLPAVDGTHAEHGARPAVRHQALSVRGGDRRPRRVRRVARARSRPSPTCTTRRRSAGRRRAIPRQLRRVPQRRRQRRRAERRAWRADAHGATPVEVAEAIRTGPGNMPVFGPGTFTPTGELHRPLRRVPQAAPGSRRLVVEPGRTDHRGPGRDPRRPGRADAHHPLDRAPGDAPGTAQAPEDEQ